MKNKGLLIFIGVVLVVILFISGCYNGLVSAEESVRSAWAQVESVYQRRLDLIPNLVETVKGYAAHEQETLREVVDARARVSQINVTGSDLADPAKLQNFQDAQGGLSSAISRLLVVVERYPDLKANQNFLALQSQLEGTENRISVERMRFNEAAQKFNIKRRTFPTVFVANLFGFQEKAYFKADQAASQAPKVSF